LSRAVQRDEMSLMNLN